MPPFMHMSPVQAPGGSVGSHGPTHLAVEVAVDASVGCWLPGFPVLGGCWRSRGVAPTLLVDAVGSVTTRPASVTIGKSYESISVVVVVVVVGWVIMSAGPKVTVTVTRLSSSGGRSVVRVTADTSTVDQAPPPPPPLLPVPGVVVRISLGLVLFLLLLLEKIDGCVVLVDGMP